MKYGYARVLTDDQTPALQLAALKKAGCKTVFKDDGISGATTQRPALLRCLKKLEPGDTLIVWKLDPQLARPDNHARRPEMPGYLNSARLRTSTPTRRQAAPCGK